MRRTGFESKKVTIDDGHAIHPPVLGMTADHLIDLFDVLDRAAH